MTRIAIVEDKAVIRESLAAYVHTDPELRCVCACGSAEEALRELPKHQPEIVLMDIQLPRQSGIECTAQLKQLLPAIKIIMVTVYGEPERIFQALRAGASGYLTKDSEPERARRRGVDHRGRHLQIRQLGYFMAHALQQERSPVLGGAVVGGGRGPDNNRQEQMVWTKPFFRVRLQRPAGQRQAGRQQPGQVEQAGQQQAGKTHVITLVEMGLTVRRVPF